MKLEKSFFRHEYGRLVARLTRIVGTRHIEAAEDAAQEALLAALDAWTTGAEPDNPSAWLFRVAQNKLLDELRTHSRRVRLADEHARGELVEDAPPASLTGDMNDDLLRMLFVSCDDAIPLESQVAFALKVLCGFDVREIATLLFTNEAAVYKRLARARDRLHEARIVPSNLTDAQLAARLSAVQAIVYAVFTEGYLSLHDDVAMRADLCAEAIRLGELLAAHPVGQTPETFALLALMHLHESRAAARQDATGGLLLLEEQDRSLWDADRIARGLELLARSATGDAFSRYHAEAGIAAEHCLAASFATTRWERVVSCYELLERVSPSPIHTLNRAVAVAEWRGPRAGLAILEARPPPLWLAGSFMWTAVLADLHARCGNEALARSYEVEALAAAPTAAVKNLLQRRFTRARR